MHDVVIRAAGRRDAEGIRTIYNHYVNHSTTLFDMVARTLDEQVQWIDEHCGIHPAVVADLDGEIGGFGSLSTFRSRPAYSTTVEDSVYLLDGHKGRGIGRRIRGGVLRLASAHGFHSRIARITGENHASMALPRTCGFEIVGVGREVGRKFGQWLDVVEMQKLL